jgi:hypothetical protein
VLLCVYLWPKLPWMPGGRRHAAAMRAVVFVAYGLLACLVTWPLPIHLQTHLLGAPGGDTGVYVWNLWIFRHEILRHAHVPFSTDHVFAYTGGADFAIHNYTPIAGILGLPLIGPLGVVGAFNTVLISFIALAGCATYALGRRLGLSPWAAWLGGALFAASPIMTAKETAHLSLVIAAPLPLFLWALLRVLESRRKRDALLVGLLVAVAAYSDAYYGIYCALMGAFVIAWRFTEWTTRPPTILLARLVRGIDGLLAALSAVVLWRLFSGPADLVLGGLVIKLQTLYNPVLVLVLLAAIRVWLSSRPRVRIVDRDAQLTRLRRLGGIAVAACLVLMIPVIAGIVQRAINGQLPATETFWRSSPRGVDVLAYVVPNPTHPWFGDVTRPLFLPPRADAFPEFAASFSLVALVILAIAAWRGLLPRMWVAFTAGFAMLSLGPFIHVAGVNTYVIGPWALLRYLPIVGLARSPSRFAMVAALGLAVLFAFAIQALWRRRVAGAPVWAGMVAVVLAVELLPAPRPLYSAAVPRVYEMIATSARNPDDSARLLELPTGLRDGTSSVGNFNPASLFYQTRHRRPLLGGYLSRVSGWRKQINALDPMMNALTTLSEGRELPAPAVEEARAWRDTFLTRSCVRYVVLDKARAPADLSAFAVNVLRLARVHADADYELLTPIDPPSCEAPRPPRRHVRP